MEDIMDRDHTTVEEYFEQIEEATKEKDYDTAIAILEILKEKQERGEI